MKFLKNRFASFSVAASSATQAFLGLALLVACATPAMQVERAPASEIAANESPEIEICQSGRERWQSFTWCLKVPRDFRSRTLIYFLHGRGGDENAWKIGIRPNLEADWRSRNVAPPAVATITFGSSWFVSEQPGMLSRSTQELLLSVIIPAIESKLPAAPSARVLYGESMGGFNAIQLFTKDPARWNRVALDCPAILAVGPTSSPAEVEGFIQRQKGVGRRDLIQKWLGILNNAFHAKGVWAIHNPLTLAERADVNSPPVLVIADDHDEFGFYEGTRAFVQKLKDRGVRFEAQTVPNGTHCTQSPVSFAALSNFLMPN